MRFNLLIFHIVEMKFKPEPLVHVHV
jgi:hypothetical protein